MDRPFVIMPGDELRLDQDALDVIERSDFCLVRVAQYLEKSRTDLMMEEIKRRGLVGRVFLFERIDYAFLRFLMQRAVAYVGLVDSRWQPAGWTVACEALACDLPVVVYEGLVSRELQRLGAQKEWLRSVTTGDLRGFRQNLEEVATNRATLPRKLGPKLFATENLDLEATGDEFGRHFEESFRNS
jgi:glycosyltransferase involved in cell wall biosynthesis